MRRDNPAGVGRRPGLAQRRWLLLALTTFLQIAHADTVDDLVQQEMNAHRFPGDGLNVIVLTNTDEMVVGPLARKVAPFYFGQRKEH